MSVGVHLGNLLAGGSQIVKGRRERRRSENCLTQCTTSSISEAKRKHVGDLRASPSKQEIPPPVWHLQYLYAVPQYPAARENGRLHVHLRILGVRRDATIENARAACFGLVHWFTTVCRRFSFVFDPYPPGRASLRAHTIYTRYMYIFIYMSLQRADAERHPVSNRPRIAHMCGCCARGTGSGEISNRSASPKYQPVPWLQ